jgi:hypothetical protein
MVEGTVIDHMFENVLSLEGLRWLVEQYRARRKKSNALEERIESLKGELATHEAAMERLMDLAEAGGGGNYWQSVRECLSMSDLARS